jgi:hypothetical protein
VSIHPDDEEVGDRLGVGLIAGVSAFVATWSLTEEAFLSLGLGILSFLLASGRLVSLARQLDAHLNHKEVPKSETRGLEDSFITSKSDADSYWSSYDGGQIWEQRSLQIETGAQYVTHYDQMRVNIPQLYGPTISGDMALATTPLPNEPLGNFWSRYRAGAALGHNGDQHTDVELGRQNGQASMPPPADYSHLPPHLALVEEAIPLRIKIKAAANLEQGEFGIDLKAMVKNVEAIVEGLKLAPSKLSDVQRLFTYYLPEVANLLEARQHMLSLGEIARVDEIEMIVERIEKAFATFARRMHEADIRALDIDLKLLDQSLAAEFETQNGT